jgi:ABC-type transport system substrate-binding protein
MPHFAWWWPVPNNVSAIALAVLMITAALTPQSQAETRPTYGGVLRVATSEALASLDPADAAQPDSFARRSVTLLIFETLVTTDSAGQERPALAVGWQPSPEGKRWQFRLRQGVKFHDGTALTPEIAVASLRDANPAWNVLVDGDAVVIQLDAADPELLAELALPRNAIAKRASSNPPLGTGPFHVVDWAPGKKLMVAAEEDYWGGRPFLDSVVIEMGRSYRDQMMAMDLGKADLVEIAPEQARRLGTRESNVASSAPLELLALVFAREASSPDDKLLRDALSLSVERGSMRSVLLQGEGQAAAGILPDWQSGYEFVFPADADLAKARQLRGQVRNAFKWTIGYDNGDPLERLLAERIALNARDAGLSLQVSAAPAADLQLVRIPLPADPWLALTAVSARAGLTPARNKPGSVEDLYAAEQAALAGQRLIPLFHLPASYAAGAALRNWSLRPDGSWNLADAWLGSGKP